MTSTSGPGSRPLRDRVLDLVDSDKTVRQTVEGMQALVADPAMRAFLTARGFDVDNVAALTREYNRLVDITTRSFDFASLGWAPTADANSDAYADALRALDAGEHDRAEEIIADSWDHKMVIRRPVHRLSRLGLPDRELNEPFRLRADLLHKAVEHHVAGAYEASVPILLAQCEGLVADVTGGKLFFSKSPSRMADIVSSASLATLDEALPVVRELFSRGMDTTAATGQLGRHGILHGRELGYHTRVNSLKCFVLLNALVDWAESLMDAETERRQRDSEHQWTGSTDTDERGKRRDRREFAETCSVLHYLSAAHMGWYRRESRYLHKVLAAVSSPGPTWKLPAPHGITMHISDDGQMWWAWRQTETGWVFGIGAIGPPPAQCFYDGPTPPPAPDSDPTVWTQFTAGPNWATR